MRLCKACEQALKHGVVTVGEAILYIENHANEYFSADNVTSELMELVAEADEYGDDCLADDVIQKTDFFKEKLL